MAPPLYPKIASVPSSAMTWTMVCAPETARPTSGWVPGCRTCARSDIARLWPTPPAIGYSEAMRHIIGILLQNEAGALTRVAAMFSSRGYNIESLAVATTNDPTVSRLTLVTSGSEEVMLQIVNQLKKLIDVVSVEDMTRGEHIERELVLIKLRLDAARRDTVRGYVIRTGGRVLDPSSECFIVELLGSEAEINGFMRNLATQAELVEVVRSGALGISRELRALRLVE